MSRQSIYVLAALAMLHSFAAAQPPVRVVDVEEPSESPFRPVQLEQPAVPLSDAGVRFAWEQEPENSPFRAGNLFGLAYFSGVQYNIADEVRFHSATVSTIYFFEDNLSVSLEASAIYGDRVVPRRETLFPYSFRFGEGSEGTFHGGAGQIVWRCHYLNYGTWSLYAEVGNGISYLTRSVPADGTNFNFILLGGVGFTKQISDSIHFTFGHRWLHLSNGGTRNRNPAYDGFMWNAGFFMQF